MYDYREAITADILDYIHENYTPEEINKNLDNFDNFADRLQEDLWIEDSVTGNGSGSYTFNRERAREYVLAEMDLLLEALREFCVEGEEIARRFLSEDWEYFDVTIRCYLLSEAICTALDILSE